MARFNTRTARPSASSPVTTTGERTATYEGGTGYLRDTKSELFLLAVTNMVGTDTFYENGGDRDDRYTQLVRTLAVSDPAWCVDFLHWLRSDANMRTASLVGAAEFVKGRLDAGRGSGGLTGTSTLETEQNGGYNRQAIRVVLQRADEPGELLAYWTSRYGRRIPKPVKRGIEDAVGQLYNERALLKYDTNSHGFRFGDVIELVHPSPAALRQGDLFEHAIDRRHNRDKPIPESLQLIHTRAAIGQWPVEKRRAVLARPDAAEFLNHAGMTWEALAGWLQGPMDRLAWEAIIPSMGYMALLRNLRNFDEAGVSDEVAETIAQKLADPEQVARSRQLPMRFYSAYNAAPSLRWGHALEKALTASLSNVPYLNGRTLVLVDTSGSMNSGFSRDGTLMRWDAAVVFGLALALRCQAADVVSFSASWGHSPASKEFDLRRGASLLREIERWKNGGWFLCGGTDTAGALRRHFSDHDRVVIVTDEQAAYSGGDVTEAIPKRVPLYTWNLAGYRAGHTPSGSGNRHTFGGLTDAAFRMIPLLEAGRDAGWPWEG